MPFCKASSPEIACSAAYLRTSSVLFPASDDDPAFIRYELPSCTTFQFAGLVKEGIDCFAFEKLLPRIDVLTLSDLPCSQNASYFGRRHVLHEDADCFLDGGLFGFDGEAHAR